MASPSLWKLVPVILLLIFVGIFGWVGYQLYLYTQQLADRGQRHMEKRNISFSKDGGMKVGVKQMNAEEYSAKTQGYLVKAWNLSTWPEYRSRFWNQEEMAKQNKLKAEKATADSQRKKSTPPPASSASRT